MTGIDLSRESAPDGATLLKFRRLLEPHGLTRTPFETIRAHLAERALLMREGTRVDATLIAAPPSRPGVERRRGTPTSLRRREAIRGISA